MTTKTLHELYASDVLEVLPAEDVGLPADEHSTLGLVELLLKNPRRLDALAREEDRQTELLPRFLGIALTSYTLFGLAMVVILNAAPAAAYPHQWLPVPEVGSVRSSLALVFAYDLGLVGATGICLPAFYFFSLLAGVRLSMTQITGQVLRCKSSSAVVLLGVLPIYVAVVLGMVVFGAPMEFLEGCLYVGLVLPFLAGMEGVRCIYEGVLGMADALPPEQRCRRVCFLRRLTLSWAAVYTAVSPVMIYTLWKQFE